MDPLMPSINQAEEWNCSESCTLERLLKLKEVPLANFNLKIQ